MEHIKQRIKEVCSTKAGWLDGDGDAVEADPAIIFIIVKALIDSGFDSPDIYPTHDGNIQLEWPDMTIVISCEIDDVVDWDFYQEPPIDKIARSGKIKVKLKEKPVE